MAHLSSSIQLNLVSFTQGTEIAQCHFGVVVEGVRTGDFQSHFSGKKLALCTYIKFLWDPKVFASSFILSIC